MSVFVKVGRDKGKYIFKAFPYDVSGGHIKGVPCLHQYNVHVGRCVVLAPMIQYPGYLGVILKGSSILH